MEESDSVRRFELIANDSRAKALRHLPRAHFAVKIEALVTTRCGYIKVNLSCQIRMYEWMLHMRGNAPPVPPSLARD